MAKLTVTHTLYGRYVPIMTYEMEINGNVFEKGQMSTYNILEGVEEGLNRLLGSLDRSGIYAEAITLSGVVLNAGTQQFLTDKYTNNTQVASLIFA